MSSSLLYYFLRDTSLIKFSCTSGTQTMIRFISLDTRIGTYIFHRVFTNGSSSKPRLIILSDLANRLKIKYITFKCVLRKFAEVQVKDVNMTPASGTANLVTD